MLGILCGLEQEAAIARGVSGAHVACSGARPHLARALTRDLIQRGATKLISFGIAGALEPSLRIGAVIIGSSIASKDGDWPCDPALIAELSRKIPEAQVGGVWGSEVIVATAREKRALFETSGCLIVDMESQCAAETAAAAGVPFVAVRTVCDTSSMELPPLVTEAVREDGGVAVSRALWSLLRRPGQIPALVGVISGTGGAVKALRRHAKALEG